MSEKPVHMTVVTVAGVELKCGEERKEGIRLTDDPSHVTCPQCAKGS